MAPTVPIDLPPDAILAIVERFKHLSKVAMHDMFGRIPYEWQVEIISHLSMMKTIGTFILIQPTCGGKPSVRDVYSVMCAGLSLTITPLLSLGADQTEKIWKNASQNGGPVHSFHLDKLRCPQAHRLLSERILSLSVDTHTTIFIFSSQQALVNNKV
jgi:hypothetical protein